MRRCTAAVVAAAGLVAMAATPASAAPSPAISPTARTAAAAAITSRLADLNARVTLVTDSPALSAGDRSALLSELDSTISGLQTLDTTITNETSQAAFRNEALDIFSNFRVYALVLPQVHLVRAADELTSVVIPDFQRVQAALQQRINTEQGKDISATVAPMGDLAHQIQAIETDTNGVSATLLPLTPAEWNANHTIVSGPRQMLGSARTAAVQALADVNKVRAEL